MSGVAPKDNKRMFDDILKPSTQTFLAAVIVFMLFISVVTAIFSGFNPFGTRDTPPFVETFLNTFMYSMLICSIPIIISASVIQMASEWPEGSKNRKA